VEDEVQVVLEIEHHAFAEVARADDATAFRGAERWLDGAQQVRTPNARPLETLAHDVRAKRFDVERDVRVFGHGAWDTRKRGARGERVGLCDKWSSTSALASCVGLYLSIL